MKILLKAAFRSRKHLKWLICSFFALVGVTIADQLEMLAIGVIINNVGASSSTQSSYPIHHFLDTIRSYFEFSDRKIQKVAILLLCVAFFKGFFLFFSRYTTRVLAIKISRDLPKI